LSANKLNFRVADEEGAAWEQGATLVMNFCSFNATTFTVKRDSPANYSIRFRKTEKQPEILISNSIQVFFLA
jgi:hypothetical protein